MNKTAYFSPESLEQLYIAILKLRNNKNLALCISPEDVLQPWVLEQLPDNLHGRSE